MPTVTLGESHRVDEVHERGAVEDLLVPPTAAEIAKPTGRKVRQAEVEALKAVFADPLHRVPEIAQWYGRTHQNWVEKALSLVGHGFSAEEETAPATGDTP